MIYLGSDKAGLDLKKPICSYLEEQKINFEDLGCYASEAVDYPDITKLVVEKVLEKENNKGVLICGTGIGVSISANRFSGIYATPCNNLYSAQMARKHNNSNILTLGSRILAATFATKILEVWLTTDFEGGRHSKRLEKIDKIKKL